MRTEISSLEEQKKHISEVVKALVVSARLTLSQCCFIFCEADGSFIPLLTDKQ